MTKRPMELQDLSASKRRVIANVEQRLQARPSKKKKLTYGALAVAAALGITFGISQLAEPNAPATSDAINQYESLIEKYTPLDGTYVQTELSNGYENSIFTQWLSPTYYKQTTIGPTYDGISYYRIQDNKLEFIAESNLEEPYTLEQLEAMPSTETILTAPFKKERDIKNRWFIAETNLSWAFYEDVIKLVFIQDDGARQERYYAPAIGLIEERYYIDDTLWLSETIVSSSQPTELNPTIHFEKTDYTTTTPLAHTDWQYSPAGQKRATIEGRGVSGHEEGVAQLLVEQISSGSQTTYSLTNDDAYTIQATPKAIRWINERYLFVIIGTAYGSVTRGGDLYLMELGTGKLTPLIAPTTTMQEIMAIERVTSSTFTYTEHRYNSELREDDDTTIREGTIDIVVSAIESITANTITLQQSATAERIELPFDLQHSAIPLEALHENAMYEFIIIDGVIRVIQHRKHD